jgi:imidazolonepropionase-like amidohydrolase
MSKRSPTRRCSNARWVCLLVSLIGLGISGTAPPSYGRLICGGPAHASSSVNQDNAQEASESSPAVNDAPTASPVSETGQLVAIVNAVIHTMEREGTLEQATLMIDGGHISEVGCDVAIPEHAKVIDAKGGHLTPGLIDVRSRLFLADGVDQAADGSLDAVDGLNRFDSTSSEVLSAGVTTVYLQPAGSFGGFGATVATVVDSNSDSDLGVWKTRAAAQMSLVGSATETSRARKQRYEALRKRLQDAKDYQKAWADYREALAKHEAAAKEPTPTPTPPASAAPETPASENRERPAGGRGRRPSGRPDGSFIEQNFETETGIVEAVLQEPAPEPNRRRPGPPQEQTAPPASTPSETPQPAAPTPPKKPDFDALKECLLPVLNREVPVRFEVQRAEEIQWALSLGTDFNLRLILEGLREMKSATQAVQDSQHAVVLGPWLVFSNQADNREIIKHWGSTFGASGPGSPATTRLVIATFAQSPMGSKWLRYHAAAAVSAGVSRDQAMRGVTIEAAQVAGVSDQVGSLKVGKVADLVLFAGHPLDSRSAVTMVIKNGQVVVDRVTTLQLEAPVHLEATNSEPATSAGAQVSTPSKPSWPSQLPTAYAIRSERVLTADGTWQPATIIVNEQKITAVSASHEVPPSLRVFDVGERPVTSGLQSAWVVNASAVNPIAKESDAAQQFAADGFDPASPTVRRMVDSGLTGIHLVNSPTNVIAGQSAWLLLGNDETLAPGKRQPAAEQWSLGGTARNEERYPATLVGQVAMIRNRMAGQLSESTLYLPESALQKLMQQKTAQREAVASGNLPVFVDAGTDAEIDAALRLIAGTKVKAWVCGPNQLRPYSKRLAENQMGVVVLPPNEQTHHWYFEDLVQAHEDGVRLLLAGENGVALRTIASSLVNAGLDPVTGRRLLTIDTGVALTQGQPIGLSVGATADWIVWSDDPLDLSSQLLWHSRGQR